MLRHFRYLTLLTLLAVALTACAATPATQPTAVPAASPTPIPAPTAAPTSAPAPTVAASVAVKLTDDLGRTVTLAAMPQRIVSLAPSVTEILFAVGAGPQVVGDTEFCNYPPEADALPEIGGFSATSISVEAIVGLEPDLVIAGTTSHKSVVEQLEALGITTVVLAPESFDAVYTSIAQIGALTGHAADAEAVVDTMRMRVAAVGDKVAPIPASERPSVYWEVADNPLVAAGPNTFIDQMLTLVGATNIFADASESYPQVSAETVIARDPAVILGPAYQGTTLSIATIRERPGWADVKAVRDGRVYLLDNDIVSRLGPRLADAVEALAATLYPETFK